MLPLSDVIPSRSTPYCTIGLIAVTAVVFGVELALDAGRLQALIGNYGLVPAAFSPPTILTSLFLHAGWVHVAGNMLYLWIFGDNVEDRLGHVAYLLFYLLCGAAAAVGHVILNSGSVLPMIGASGAVSGVMGAYFVLYPHSRVLAAVFIVIYLDLIEVPAVYFLGIWFLLQLLSGIATVGVQAVHGGTALWAHLAGLGTGAIVGVALRLANGRHGPPWSA